MTAIKTQNFGGMIPAVNSRSLPPNAATDVVNGRVHEGKITPFQQLSAQHTFPAGSAFKSAIRIPDAASLDGSGYTWLGGTSMNFSFSRPAINEDLYERYAYCNGDYKSPVLPRFNTLANIRNGVADYLLGVPLPSFKPAVSVSGGTTTNPTETRAYVCTYQDIYGEESGPTDGGTAVGEPDGTWVITGFAVPPTPAAAGRVPVQSVNLYRSIVTSATAATYYQVAKLPISGAASGTVAAAGSGYVAGDTIYLTGGTYSAATELLVTNVSATGGVTAFLVAAPGLYTAFPTNPVAQASTSGTGTGATFTMIYEALPSSFTDTQTDLAVSLANTTLQTAGCVAPPPLEGFISVANGFLCGWAGNQIYFSQPSQPWSWPIAYQISVDSQIVGMGYLDNSIIVLTTSSPFQITGTTPSTMTLVKVSTINPCVSRGSIAQAIDGVDFAARNGIINASPFGFNNVSDKVISTEEYRQSYFGSIIAGVRYEDTYMGLTGTGTGYVLALQGYEGGYFMNPQNVRIALSRFMLSQPITNMFTDPFTSDVLMMAGQTVYLWDDPNSGTMVCRYKSKEFASSQPVNFAMCITALDELSFGPQNSDDPTAVALGEPLNPDPVPTASFEALGGLTSLVGYTIVGAAVVGSGAQYGTKPPGMTTDPLAPIYPFWPGLLTPQANGGQGGAGPGGVNDPDYNIVPSLPAGVSSYLEVYSNRFTIYSNEIVSNVQTRLPSGFKSNLWQFKITTAVPVWSFAMAATGKELKGAE